MTKYSRTKCGPANELCSPVFQRNIVKYNFFKMILIELNKIEWKQYGIRVNCCWLNPTFRELKIDGDMLDEKFIQIVSEHLRLVNDLVIRSSKQLFLNICDREICFAIGVNKLKFLINSTRSHNAKHRKIALLFDWKDEISVKLSNLQLRRPKLRR